MAHQNRIKNQRKQSFRSPRPQAIEKPPIPQRKPTPTYGKPFILLEDEQKNTFKYGNGAWAPFALTIAQCREEGVAKELPQQINKMTRYEVLLPVSFEQ